MIASQCIERL
jgi:casein kinase 1, epsilon